VRYFREAIWLLEITSTKADYDFMTILLTILSLLFNQTQTYSQTDLIKQIDQKVNFIDSDQSLNVKKFDINKVYNQNTDGNGEFIIYLLNNKIVKVEQYVVISNGKISTIIYLNKNKSIAIIEKEENFVWNEKESSFDYSKLKEVFQEKIYLSELESISIITQGERNISDPSCSVSEYLHMVTIAKSLLEKK